MRQFLRSPDGRVQRRPDRLAAVILAALFAFALVVMNLSPVLAGTVSAGSGTNSISGKVRDNQGNPVNAGAVTLRGSRLPSPVSTTTGPDGSYSFTNVPDGSYSVSALKQGLTPATITDVVVGNGVTSYSINFQLLLPTMNSVQTLGRVITTATRQAFNTSTAAQVTVSSEVFQTQNETSVSRLLNEIPGVMADNLGGYNSSNQFAPKQVSVRGAMDYESQQTLDGHAISNGIQGAFRTNLLDTAVLDEIEVVKGPGSAPTTITSAIGGSVNYRLREPTSEPYWAVDFGTDSFWGSQDDLIATGTTANRRWGYAFVYSLDTSPGYNLEKTLLPVSGPSVDGRAVAAQPWTYGSIAGWPGSPPYYQSSITATWHPAEPVTELGLVRNELAKLRYHFSDSTSASVAWYGQQGGYEYQTGYIFLEPTIFAPGAGYTGNIPTGSRQMINLDSSVNNAGFIKNSEPTIEADFRTRVGKGDTLLGRYYNIHLVSQFWVPVTTTHAPLWGTLQLCPVGQFTDGFSGNCGPQGGPYTTPAQTVAYNGQLANLNTIYAYSDEAREDKTLGASLQYDHPVANNLYTVSYDNSTEHNLDQYKFFSSGAFYGGIGIPPGAKTIIGTLMVRGLLSLSDKFSATIADYVEHYDSRYSLDGGLSYKAQTFAHDDFRAGLTFRPTGDVSWRLSAGSSFAPPYASLTNNTFNPAPYPDPVSGGFIEYTSNGKLMPETSVGFDLGSDYRFGRDRSTVLSFDTYLSNLRNQFYYAYLQGGSFSGKPLYLNTPENLNKARFEGVELAVRHNVPVGLGFSVSGNLQRAYTYDLPKNFYLAPGGTTPVQNLTILPQQNFTSGGVYGSGYIPYSMGYGEVNYRTRRGYYLAFGETYHGPNNPQEVPAYFTARATLRLQINNNMYFQISGENLFNALSFPYEWYGDPAGIAPGQVKGAPYAAVPEADGLGTRVLHFVIHESFGNPGR